MRIGQPRAILHVGINAGVFVSLAKLNSLAFRSLAVAVVLAVLGPLVVVHSCSILRLQSRRRISCTWLSYLSSVTLLHSVGSDVSLLISGFLYKA